MPALADPKAEVPDWWGDAREGGGWLGAYASHVIDQTRTMLGEWTGLSASLDLLSDRSWSAEDSYTVHFRTERGCTGVLQSSIAAWGAPAAVSRVSGARGTLTIQGDAVSVADASGSRQLDMPAELANAEPKPPDSDLLHTAYDMLHSMGIDLAPYTRVFEILRARMAGEPVADDPPAATFADGLAVQQVLDAVRCSSAEQCWVEVG